MSLDEKEVFKSLYFMDLEISGKELRDAAQKIMQDRRAGLFPYQGIYTGTGWKLDRTECHPSRDDAVSDRGRTEGHHSDRGAAR